MNPLAALEFLTTVRFRRTPGGSLDRVAQAQGYFPLVGLFLGAILVGLDSLLSRALPLDATNVLLVVALVLLTGGLHLDGLADSCDGLFGGRSREDRLAIMRDSRTGAFGVIGLVCVLGLKWAGLQSLPAEVRVEGLLLAPVLARWSLVVAIGAFPYARPEGLGSSFRARAWPWGLPVAGVTAIVIGVALLGVGGLVLVLFAAAVALALGGYVVAKLGGLTGDIYGGITEVVEALILLAIGAAAVRGWLDALLFG